MTGRVLIALCALAASSTTFAQSAEAVPDPVEQAAALVHEGDFAAAMRVLNQAETDAALEADTLVRLWELRARVARAEGSAELVESDLRRIVSVDAQYQPSAEVGPELRAELDAIRGEVEPLSLRVAGVPTQEGGRVVTEVRGGHADLPTLVRVYARHGEGRWEVREGRIVEVVFNAPPPLRYFVQLVSPQGVVYRSEGSEQAPRELSPLSRPVPAAASVLVTPPTPLEEETPRSGPPPKRVSRAVRAMAWTLFSLAIAGAVAGGLWLGLRPEPDTQLGRPMPAGGGG